VPTRGLAEVPRRAVMTFILATLIAAPMYWMGFIERQMIWLLPGVVAVLMRARPVTHTYAAPTIAFVVAALWQLTPVHAFALAGCHRPPLLAATGWRADRDCVRFGAALGWQCVVSCAPLMVACALTGHALICMAGCMALGIAERRSFRPRTRTAAAGAMVFAGYYLLLALR